MARRRGVLDLAVFQGRRRGLGSGGLAGAVNQGLARDLARERESHNPLGGLALGRRRLGLGPAVFSGGVGGAPPLGLGRVGPDARQNRKQPLARLGLGGLLKLTRVPFWFR